MVAVKLTMIDAAGKKTTKSFDKMPDTETDVGLKSLANTYKVLTNQVATTAEKIVTTDLALS